MARGGKDSAKLMEDYGVSKEEVDRLTIQVYEREMAAATKHLTEAFGYLNEALGRKDKPKSGLIDLAATINGMSRVLGGLVTYHQSKREDESVILGEVVEGRDDLEKAINARYKLKLADIIQRSMERQIRESNDITKHLREQIDRLVYFKCKKWIKGKIISVKRKWNGFMSKFISFKSKEHLYIGKDLSTPGAPIIFVAYPKPLSFIGRLMFCLHYIVGHVAENGCISPLEIDDKKAQELHHFLEQFNKARVSEEFYNDKVWWWRT